MKAVFRSKWWLLLFVPMLMQNVCGKRDEGDMIIPPNADQYVTWRVNNTNGSLQVPTDSLDYYFSNNSTSVYGMTRPTMSTYFQLSFDGPQQNGNYAASNFVVMSGGRHYYSSASPISVNVTTYGGVGQYMIGNYTGTVKDSTTSNTVPVSGTFRIKVR